MVHEAEGRSCRIHAQRLLTYWNRFSSKESSINSRRAILVGMFSWTIRMNNYRGPNPFSAVSKLNEGLKEMQTYSAEQFVTYLRTAQDVMTTGNYAAVMLIALTGRRVLLLTDEGEKGAGHHNPRRRYRGVDADSTGTEV